MHNIFIMLLAYLIDRIFGEFRFIKHPIIIIGALISWFESHYYKDSVFRGIALLLFVLTFVGVISVGIALLLTQLSTLLETIVSATIASMFIAHRMLHDSVKAVLSASDKKAAIAMLVSRDTQDMSESNIYKAAIETYAENLSDGVIAPMFYLLLFGLPGIILYKAVNTMDSMVGYRTPKYEHYGKAAARLDDILNFIPSRLTALLIMVLGKRSDFFAFYGDGKKHDSPNAGHPITAMALVLGVRLGGDTSYFGKVKKKAFFGVGRENITQNDAKKALKLCYNFAKDTE